MNLPPRRQLPVGRGGRVLRGLLVLGLLAAAAACQREAPQAADAGLGQGNAPGAGTSPQAAAGDPAPLQDSVETNQRYIIGVTYAPVINRHAGLARAIREYDAQLRADLMESVEAYGNDVPGAPYELSMSYDAVLDTPALVAIAADGSRYTGGAHGEPLVERFVWLVQEGRLLRAEDLVPDTAGWAAIGGYVQEQLHTANSLRAEGEGLPPEERLRRTRDGGEMIEEGTAPDPANFSRFEPVVDAAGRVTAVRFVFPPYQVAPYALGTQSVEVPAAVILPHVAKHYRSLFTTP